MVPLCRSSVPPTNRTGNRGEPGTARPLQQLTAAAAAAAAAATTSIWCMDTGVRPHSVAVVAVLCCCCRFFFFSGSLFRDHSDMGSTRLTGQQSEAAPCIGQRRLGCPDLASRGESQGGQGHGPPGGPECIPVGWRRISTSFDDRAGRDDPGRSDADSDPQRPISALRTRIHLREPCPSAQCRRCCLGFRLRWSTNP